MTHWMDNAPADAGDERDYDAIPDGGTPTEPNGHILTFRRGLEDTVRPMADELAARRRIAQRDLRYVTDHPDDAA